MKPIYVKKNGEVSKVSGVINPQTYSADDITYDNTTSGLTADDVQEAIDEVVDGLGTAASKDIPDSGDASSTQVVMGDDSRLTDARTPLSHTHTTSDITNFPTLGTAAAKNYTTSVTQNSTDLVTSGAVWTAIDSLPEPMIMKGTLGTNGTITDLPTASADNEGFVYKVITAGTYAGQVAKVGDFFVCCDPNDTDTYSWIWFPSGDETFTDTWRAIKVNGTEVLGNGINTGYINHINGNNTTVAFDVGSSSIAINASDEKVKQSPNTTDSDFEILFSGTADNTEHTEGVKKTATLRFNPGKAALMEGSNTVASGGASHAEGYQTTASGRYSHAEGQRTIASEIGSHAEGYQTTASGNYSHAEGQRTLASEIESHAEGCFSSATGSGSHAEGYHAKAIGTDSHAEGSYTSAPGDNSHAEGYSTSAAGKGSHAEGGYTSSSGGGTLASGDNSHAEGFQTCAIGKNSHAEGRETRASGEDSHSSGQYAKATGSNSHAEGYSTSAAGTNSHAEGGSTTASSTNSHAEGQYTIVSGTGAHAEGYYATASGNYSHASGSYTSAAGDSQTVIGKYNVADTTSLFIVGNGTANNARSNAMKVSADGDLSITKINGVTVGDSPKFTDNNTTYTFANGTNGFTVTPSGGTAQTVTVTPSITNNITGSGTSGYLTKFNGTNTITNGPQLGSSTTTYLRNDGIWATPTDTNTHRPIQVNGTEILGNNTTALNLKAGSNVSLSNSSGTVTIAATDTNNRKSFYGTCDTAAATAAKVVTLADTSGWELKAGTVVGVKFTNSNSASNVTLNVNGTGAKSIWYNNAAYTGSSVNVCGYANRVYYYMYDGSTYWVWMSYSIDLNDNTNTYDRNLYTGTIKCGTTAIVAVNIIVGKDGVFTHLKSGGSFDINYPILYAASAIAANATGSNNYDVLAISLQTTQSITLTAYLPVYIKGSLSGKIFTPVSTTPLTQTIPTTEDGYHYMLLGVAYSTTHIYLDVDHRIYAYKNGAFGEIVHSATNVNGYTVAKSVPSNAVFTDTKNTAGSTDTSSKIFLVGATSQAANPQTYSDDQVYATNGTLTANNLVASNILGTADTSGTGGGISLHGAPGYVDDYGIMLRRTSDKEKHGYVQSDWATYFTMNDQNSRGWIFRRNKTTGNVASIDTSGNAVFNGSVTVGGNTANTSGARMEYNSTNKCIDFVFV